MAQHGSPGRRRWTTSRSGTLCPRFRWQLSAALLPVAAASGARRASCLLEAAYTSSQRQDVVIDGVKQVLVIGDLDWTSAFITNWILKILIEEMLGINVEFDTQKTSSSALAMAILAGCQDAVAFANGAPCNPGLPRFHLSSEVWATEGMLIMKRQLEAAGVPLPIYASDMGYLGYETTFVPASAHRQALQDGFIPLEYYRVYAQPSLDTTKYFSSPWSLPQESITPCNMTDLSTDSLMRAYLRQSNDVEGVVATSTSQGLRYTANCTDGRWWMSPRCRRDPSKCMPMLTAGSGWYLANMVQQVTAWDVPVAVGVIRNAAVFQTVLKYYNALFYWYTPGDIFQTQSPVAMIWPWHSPTEYAAGNYRTASPQAEIAKWVSSVVTSRDNHGMELVLPMVSRVKLTMRDMVDLLERESKNIHSIEGLVCQWLNENMDRVRTWIPEATECMEGQGLVSKLGAFVPTVAKAERCAWCTAGTMSTAVNGSKTYHCKRCDPGSAQSDMAQVTCKLCVAGTYAGQDGLTLCERCPIGKHSALEGQSACTACPQKFTTMQEGSVDADCVCESGSYRDTTIRSSCKACKDGMTCPPGSDALGFIKENAAQYPVVPLLSAGYWSSSEEPLNVFRCESYIHCPGAMPPGRPCGPLLKDQACAHCEDNYEWNPARKKCESCGSQSVFLFPILPIALSPVFICLLYRLFGDTYESWGSWRNGSVASIVLIVMYFQLLSVILGADIQFPFKNSIIYRVIAMSTDVLAMFPLKCAGATSFAMQLILKSGFPLLGAVMYAATWGVSHMAARCSPVDVRMENSRTMNGYCSLVFSLIAGIADMSFTIFKCAPNPNGKYTLRTDRSVTCYEDAWYSLMAVGVANIMIWCVGFLGYICFQIYRAPRMFTNRAFQIRNQFLFLRYRPDRHWWGLVIFAKAILANLGSVLAESGFLQVYFIMFMLIIYTALVFCSWPWRHGVNSVVDGLANLLLIASCAIISWLARDTTMEDTTRDARIAEAFLSACQVAAISLVIPAILKLVKERFCSRARQKSKLEKMSIIIDMLTLFSEVAREDQEDFLRGLCETDLKVMTHAQELIEGELTGKTTRPGYHGVDERGAARKSVLDPSASANRRSFGRVVSEKGTEDTSEDAFAPRVKAFQSTESKDAASLEDESPCGREDSAYAVAEIASFIDEIQICPSLKKISVRA